MRRTTRCATTVRAVALVLLALSLANDGARAGGSIAFPVTDGAGQPVDVGLLILGHSTSATGDWPGKLARALNEDPSDGRNYVVFRAITSGDGGFLWSALSFPPSDLQYDRVQGSQAASQWCQDNSGVRWSCRRLRLERGLTGADPAPPECAPPNNNCTPPLIASCVWHEGGQRFEEVNVDFNTCWDRMDVRLALVQDTTNRSWAIDDNTGDGIVNDSDFFLVQDVNPAGRPCGGTSGVIGNWVDWNCDGTISGATDSSRTRYAAWLRGLAQDLLDTIGTDHVDHVFFSQKPIEMNGCPYFPGEPCSFHGIRTPTPARPFDHFYFPTVYWELQGLESLFRQPDLDARIHWATPTNHLRMWNRSVQCYDVGIPSGDWTIPLSAGRPASIAADDSENDAANSAAVGCVGADHVHHNEAGGWMMADVWYSGLRAYLQDLAPPPSGASETGDGQAQMLVTEFDKATGLVTLSYGPACRATDHAVHSGPLAAVASYGFNLTRCGLGTSGAAQIDVGAGDRFWVIAGRDGYQEGSAGLSSSGFERLSPPPIGPCFLPRRLGGDCP